MSSVLEITTAIRDLPKDEFWNLVGWFDEMKANAWDDQMQADAAAGEFDGLFAEAEASVKLGQAKPWPPSK